MDIGLGGILGRGDDRRPTRLLLGKQVADGGLGQDFAAHDPVDIGGIQRFILVQRLGDGFDAIMVASRSLRVSS